MNYLGNIYTKFHEVLKKQDGLSVGEKLFSIERELGGSFILATDEGIFEAMESFMTFPVDLDRDEAMSDEEWEKWINAKFAE